jgi:hypothetical protein
MTAMAYPRALPPKKASIASTTRARTFPCGAGCRGDDESWVKTGSVMGATRVCGIPAAALGLAAPAEADVDTDIANQPYRTAAARRATTPHSWARSSMNAWTSMPTGRPNAFRATCGEARRGRRRASSAIK